MLETCAHLVADCSISNFDAAGVTLKIQRMSLRWVSILMESAACCIIGHQYCSCIYTRPDAVKTATCSAHSVITCIFPGTNEGCRTLFVAQLYVSVGVTTKKLKGDTLVAMCLILLNNIRENQQNSVKPTLMCSTLFLRALKFLL
jgi:hypothetical protein